MQGKPVEPSSPASEAQFRAPVYGPVRARVNHDPSRTFRGRSTAVTPTSYSPPATARRSASAMHEHPDLFWGLRGGGGNFGVATELELAVHPVGPTVLGGMLVFDWARAGEVLARLSRADTRRARRTRRLRGAAAGASRPVCGRRVPRQAGPDDRRRRLRRPRARGAPRRSAARARSGGDRRRLRQGETAAPLHAGGPPQAAPRQEGAAVGSAPPADPSRVKLTRDRTDPGPSPSPRPPRTRGRTSPASRRWRRPRPAHGGSSSSRRRGRRGCRST
jgi:hypothetical protein